MPARWRSLVAGSVVAAMVVAGPAVAQDRDDLAQARARIEALEDQLDAAAAEADGAELDLVDAEHRLAQVEAVVNQVAQRVAGQRQAVRDAENDLEALDEQQEQARQAVQRRAVQLYKTGSAGGVFALLQATDIQAAVERSELLTLLDADDQAVLETLASSAGRTEAAQEVLAAEAAVLDGLLDEQTEIMATAEKLRDSRALAAAAAAAEVARVEEAHGEAEDEATRLEDVIRKAEVEAAARAEAARQEAERAAARAAAQRTADTADTAVTSGSSTSDSDTTSSSGTTSSTTAPEPPPAPSGGGYVWPACGSVTSEFGWRWGRPHNGLDIDDNVSSAIYASQSGTVISAGWNSGGYGNLTLIKHGDGVVTAYAHQASIHVSTGQTVSRGQQIGIIGTTGHSTGTHLHFETRVGGGAVNPRNFLSGGC